MLCLRLPATSWLVCIAVSVCFDLAYCLYAKNDFGVHMIHSFACIWYTVFACIWYTVFACIWYTVFACIWYTAFACIWYTVFACIWYTVFACIWYTVFACIWYTALACIWYTVFACIWYTVFACIWYAIFAYIWYASTPQPYPLRIICTQKLRIKSFFAYQYHDFLFLLWRTIYTHYETGLKMNYTYVSVEQVN